MPSVKYNTFILKVISVLLHTASLNVGPEPFLWDLFAIFESLAVFS